MKKNLLFLLIGCLLLASCQSHQEENAQPATTETKQTESQQSAKKPAPPSPPLFENFQAQPQLSLFPRAGAFRPEQDNPEGLGFWRTYIDHLKRTSGPLKKGDNISFGFRAIKGLASIGFFSPLAVKPDTTYEISAHLSLDLTTDASAGIGIIEFNKFLWIGAQYPESLAKQHQIGSKQGLSLSGKLDNQLKNFTFTTSPETAMIHLVFFRDGAHDRNQVIVDDISIKELK